MRGATLIETLSAALVFSLLSGASCVVLIACARNYACSLPLTEVGASAASAVSRLSREVAESHPSSLRLDSSPAGVVFASPRSALGAIQVDSHGNLLWQAYVCYYLDEEGRLVRKSEALASPQTTPPAVPSDRTTAYFRNCYRQPDVVACNIASITFSGSTPLQIVVAARRTGIGAAAFIKVQTSVALRN